MTEGITVQVNMYLCRRRLTGEYVLVTEGIIVFSDNVLVTEGIIVFSDNVFMTAKVYR